MTDILAVTDKGLMHLYRKQNFQNKVAFVNLFYPTKRSIGNFKQPERKLRLSTFASFYGTFLLFFKEKSLKYN